MGPDFAVCVGPRHLGQPGLLRACEHYCNPNVTWNPDLTEVIHKCVCVSVCVQAHFKGVPAGDGTPLDLLLSQFCATPTFFSFIYLFFTSFSLTLG